MAANQRRGNDRERRVMRKLEQEGWVVASRRHIGGPGDILAVRGRELVGPEVALIEVKGTRRPYDTFGPAARRELRALAHQLGGDGYLAWWPKGQGDFVMYHDSVWR